MQKIWKQTTRRTGGTSDRTQQILGVARVLGVALCLALLHPAQSWSATLPVYSASLAWDRSPSPEVVGYRVYYGIASRIYTGSIDVGNATTAVVPGLVVGVKYYFAVTAYDASGTESDFSNETTFIPGQPRITIGVNPAKQAVLTVSGLIGYTYNVLASTNLNSWTVIGTVTMSSNASATFTDTSSPSFPKRFYRTQQKP